MCDSLNNLIIATVAEHLPCESKPLAKKAFPVQIKTPIHIEKEFMLSIPGGHFANMTFHQRITRLSYDCGSSDSYTK